MIIIVICLFASCKTFDAFLKPSIFSERAEANKIFVNLLNALENEDKESVRSMFAPDMLNGSDTIDDELDEMFNYFNGEIISYEDVGTPASSASYQEGELTYLRIGNARSGSVITDCDEYIISFSAILINKIKPTQEGIWRIWIGKNSDDYMIIGNSDMPLS